MNITLTNIDPVRATITVALKKEEYQPVVEKALNDIRKKAVMDGFRKGFVPKARIRALYGQSVLEDEINKLVNGQLNDYMRENLPNILGDPIPQEEQRVEPVYDRPEDYVFVFDVALAPELRVQLTKEDVFPYYVIAVSDDRVKEQIEQYRHQLSQPFPVETVGADDVVKGVLVEEDGDLRNDSAALMPAYIKNRDEQAHWIGARVGDRIPIRPSVAYEGNVQAIASLLGIKKEEAGAHDGDFTFTVGEIIHYQKAELGQEFYDQLYEPGTVTSEEALKEKVRQSLAQQLAPNSDYKFGIDVKKALEDRAKEVSFPEDFLKRWLIASDSSRTPESVEKEFPLFLTNLRYQLITEQLLKLHDIHTTQEEVEQRATAVARTHLAPYGMGNAPDSVLEEYVRKIFGDKQTIQKLIDQIYEDKLIQALKEQVTLRPETISLDDFKQLLKK
jgi:trigger factor